LQIHEDDICSASTKVIKAPEDRGLDIIQEIILPRRVRADLPDDERRALGYDIVLEAGGLIRRFLASNAYIQHVDRSLRETSREGRA